MDKRMKGILENFVINNVIDYIIYQKHNPYSLKAKY